MTIRIYTLGCRLNQFEIEAISTELKEKGHKIVKDNEPDFTIINTCIVTQKSEAKSRNIIHRALKTHSKIIVTGCFAKEIEKKENIIYLSNDYKYIIPQIIENWEFSKQLTHISPLRFQYFPPIKSSTTRVNLKIQDGCDQFCSYCIVPLVRGKPVSKPIQDVLREFKTLIHSGYKEIVLTGITIGKYNSQGYTFANMVEKILSLEGNFRIHISSIDPDFIEDSLLDLMQHEKMVKHLHLSLQSGSDAVLRLMNRRYNIEQYLSIIQRVKKQNPVFNFTTDVIVGFPGEMESDHINTIKLIQEVGFSHVHTFRFSPRPFTKAFTMKETVSETEKKIRSMDIIELSKRLKQDYMRLFHNKKSIFLGEKKQAGYLIGHNDYYIAMRVKDQYNINQFIPVICKYSETEQLLNGEVVED